MTVNIRSAPGDEGARIKHWVSHLSIEQAEKLTETYANILGAILDQWGRNISDLNLSKEDAPTQHAPEYGVVSSKTAASDSGDSSEDMLSSDDSSSLSSFQPKTPDFKSSGYRNLIKECVQEAIQELIHDGSILQLGSKTIDLEGSVGAKLSQIASQQTTQDRNRSNAELEPSPATENPGESSQDPLFALLRSLWSSLLRIEENKIGAQDSFFALGGDSVLAMELARSARESGYSLTVADIFGAPVFSEMLNVFSTPVTKYDHFEDGDSRSSTENESVVDPEHPGRFMLLDAANKEAFISNYICPQVGAFRGGVVDAFPVTDFQALAVAGHLLDARWMLNYIFFDGDGMLDLTRVRRSATKLVDAFEILRTVFIPCGGKFLQVVLRRMRPQVQVFDTEMDFEDFTKELTQAKQGSAPNLGEPYFQVNVIRKSGSQHHRILIRVSHAQYDGVSLPKILNAFKAFYEGSSVSPLPQFSDFTMQTMSGVAVENQLGYWKELLEGSSMTQLVSRKQPNYLTSDVKINTMKRLIKIPSLTSKNITTATIIKAAWALALNKLMGEADIVFGNLTSGRSAPVDDVESVVGPCLNLIPVRICLESKWTALELLRKVQSQQVASMGFETLGFRDIIQKCTAWPKWTYFSSTVQHQNLAEDVVLQLDQTKYSVGMMGAQDSLADISIVSTPKPGDMHEIAMGYTDNGPVPAEFIEKALDLVCFLARTVSGNPNKAISSIPDSPTEAPFVQTPTHNASESNDDYSKFDPREVSNTAAMLIRAWKIVLYSSQGKVSGGGIDLGSSFYDNGGDLVSLASLSAFLNSTDYNIRLEDLIDRPTLSSQITLLLSTKTALVPAVDPAKQVNVTVRSKTTSTDGSDQETEVIDRKASRKDGNKKIGALRARLSRTLTRKKRSIVA